MRVMKIERRIVSLFISALFALIMTVAMFPSSSFAAVNQAVTDASNGVVQVNLVYRVDNKEVTIFYGSGFLINSDTVVTCDHVVDVTSDDIKEIAKLFDVKEKDVKSHLAYSVTVNRDVTISATIQSQSVEVDWAVLKLSQSIQNRSQLSIRSSKEVELTETVYALGFPDISTYEQTVPTFTSDDVTVTDGIVNKIAMRKNLYSGANTDYIQTSVKLNEGNSGGPLVDENGYVIGVCEGTVGAGDSADFFYAIAIDQVTEVLDALGIQYTKAGGSPSSEETTEEAVTDETAEIEETTVVIDRSKLEAAITDAESKIAKTDEYSAESIASLTTELEAAKAVNNKADATQTDIDAAVQSLTKAANEGMEPAKKGLDMKWIIIIVVAVIVIAAIIIILVIMSGKKKKAAAGAGKSSASVYPGAADAQKTMPMNNVPGAPPVASSFADDAGETTLLSSDAGETTLLSRNINGGTLISVKTGEKININTEEFTIGRERNKVNYCISGNTTIGRVHAKIVNRSGKAYLVDMKATNGTFVNGVKCTPNQEVPIKSGDKITFSDVEYTYQA